MFAVTSGRPRVSPELTMFLTTLVVALGCYWLPVNILALSADPTADHRSRRQLPDELSPPVIYNQTLGPLYIKDSKQYIRISCEATDGANISWKYEGRNLSDDAVISDLRRQGIQFIVEDSGATLGIYDPEQKSLNGYFQCFVANEKGATFGDKVFVTHAVLGHKPSGSRLTTIKAFIGDHVTLSCEDHIENDPAADILWLHDNQLIHPISSSHFFCNDARSMCVLANVSSSDAGIYKCEYNIPDTPKNIYKPFKLDVIESDLNPRATHPLNLMDHVSSPSLVEARENEAVSLQCAFRGNLVGTVRWTYAKAVVSDCDVLDRAVIVASEQYLIEKNGTILTINALSLYNEGYYFCVADNGFDRYSHRIHVVLVSAPVLIDKIHGEETYLGANPRFNCSVAQAIPAAATTWWINMEPVPEEGLRRFRLENNGDILVLEGATLDDTASITCNVSNKVGSMLGHRFVTVRNMSLTTEEPSTTELVEIGTNINITGSNFNNTTNATEAINATITTILTTPNVTSVTTSASTVTSDETAVWDSDKTSAGLTTPAVSVTETTGRRESSSEMVLNPTREPEVYTNPKYFVKTPGSYEGSRSNLISDSDVRPEAQINLRMSLIMGLSGLVVGLVLGFLITWLVLRRRIRKHEPTEEIIENQALSPSLRNPNRKLLDGTTKMSETQSMMHDGIVLQETIT